MHIKHVEPDEANPVSQMCAWEFGYSEPDRFLLCSNNNDKRYQLFPHENNMSILNPGERQRHNM